jgi:hypothetical protein
VLASAVAIAIPGLAPPAATAAPRTVGPGGTGTWSALGGFTLSSVFQLIRDSSGAIVIGGNVDSAGGQSTPAHVGRWNGSTWSALGSTGSSGTNALAVDSTGQVYRALNQAQVERWNGSAWASAVSPSPNNFVQAMSFTPDGDLIVGGSFTTPESKLGRWSPSTSQWSGYGSGPGVDVSDVALAHDDTVYVTTFSSTGIRAWDGAAWSTYGGGITAGNGIDSVALDDSLVYVGGAFTSLNNQLMRNVAVGVDGVWSPLGFGLSSTQSQSYYVYDLKFDDTTGLLYVAGEFTFACGDVACSVNHDDTVPTPYLVAWYPARQKWIPLTAADGTGLSSTAYAVDTSADGRTVYAGGGFYVAGGITTGTVAQFTWDAPAITAVAPASVPENTPAVVTFTGQDLQTLRSVTVDDSAVAYSQVDDTTVIISLPAGTGTRQIRAIAAGGTSAPATFVFQSPVPPPPTPADAPRDVAGVAGDREAAVTWLAPLSSGSYPVSHYRVIASPGGHQCITTALGCSITGLTNGTAYTFTVSALTGAGWGASSRSSAPVIPQATVVTVVGVREGRTISVEGTASAGTEAVPWVRKAGGAIVRGVARPIESERFTWQRRASTPVSVYFTVGSARSNTLTL